jgi:hypothetical protein
MTAITRFNLPGDDGDSSICVPGTAAHAFWVKTHDKASVCARFDTMFCAQFLEPCARDVAASPSTPLYARTVFNPAYYLPNMLALVLVEPLNRNGTSSSNNSSSSSSSSNASDPASTSILRYVVGNKAPDQPRSPATVVAVCRILKRSFAVGNPRFCTLTLELGDHIPAPALLQRQLTVCGNGGPFFPLCKTIHPQVLAAVDPLHVRSITARLQ